MGLGLYENGSGISATRFLFKAGAKLTITDLKTKAELQVQIKRLGTMANKINFVLGRHKEADFKNVDLIIRNPGVPKDNKFLKIARKNKIPIMTDISLFFELINKKRIVAVTGTRGKSTTTSLVYEILKTEDNNAVLGGNIKTSPLAQMPLVKKGGVVVLELSSWLSESLDDTKKSPHIAVVTNIYPDHLNAYKSFADYASSKESIFRHQNLQDYCILNRDNKYTRDMGKRVPSKRYWLSLKHFKGENGCFVKGTKIVFRQDGVEKNVLNLSDIKIPGEHNLYNVLCAVCVAMIKGVKLKNIKSAVKNFKGIPDRLELLKETRGVKYYNDTTSTTPEATIAALSALGQKKNIVLIAGGSDKGLDFKQLAKEIKKHCKAIILLNGTGTERLKKELLATGYQLPVTITQSMSDAIGIAQSQAKKGDIILLSPACASFGMFKNEFDRGDQFKKIVYSIK